jgi:hypothetical protein
VISTLIDPEDQNEVHNWVHKSLTGGGVAVNVRRLKQNFGRKDLGPIIKSLGTKDDRTLGQNGEHSSNATSLSTLCVAAGTSECASTRHTLQNAVVVAFNFSSGSFPYFIDCSKGLFNVGACRKAFAERRRAELFRHCEIDLR